MIPLVTVLSSKFLAAPLLLEIPNAWILTHNFWVWSQHSNQKRAIEPKNYMYILYFPGVTDFELTDRIIHRLCLLYKIFKRFLVLEMVLHCDDC